MLVFRFQLLEGSNYESLGLPSYNFQQVEVPIRKEMARNSQDRPAAFHEQVQYQNLHCSYRDLAQLQCRISLGICCSNGPRILYCP